MKQFHLSIAAIVFAAVAAPSARGQCTLEWKPGMPIAGVNGAIHAVTSWDPDGAGPLDPWVVVGGEFTIAGNAAANRVAAWDGMQWHAFGSGMSSTVRALASYNGDLYVGTDKPTFGSSIHRWNGVGWQLTPSSPNHDVYALTVYNGELAVGGRFSQVASMAARGVARWNGTSWSTYGSTGFGTSPHVRALTVYNGELYAAGNNLFGPTGGFNIRRWTGAGWNLVGTGVNNTVHAMTVHGTSLFVGGIFTHAGGLPADRIAQWDGTNWSDLVGGGITGGSSPRVLSLTAYGNDLLVGGDFTTAGSTQSSNVARWNPLFAIPWRPMDGVNSAVNALHVPAVDPTRCVAGGNFTLAGTITTRHLAWFNGASWESPLPPGIDNWTQTLLSTSTGLYAGGDFRVIGGAQSRGVARYDGTNWHFLAGGIDTGSSVSVRSLTEYNGDLIAGGIFAAPGGAPGENGLGRWNGTSWSSMGATFGTTGPAPTIHSMTVYQNDLIVGGLFTTVNSQTANGIARYDGTAWHPMGGGMTGGTTFPIVSALVVYNGELYAGGIFAFADGVAVQSIARWNGTNWQSLGSGLAYTFGTAWAKALVVYDGDLIVGGTFDNAGGVGVSRIARWNGSAWSSLGVGTNGITALTVYGGDLHVGGGSFSSGPNTIPYVARYTGSGWSGLGTGLDASPWALAAYDGSLFVSGNFTAAGGATSNYFAEWAPACALGDLNCDQVVDFDDVGPFVAALLDPPAADICDRLVADVNRDDRLDGLDVRAFLDCLPTGVCP